MAWSFKNPYDRDKPYPSGPNLDLYGYDWGWPQQKPVNLPVVLPAPPPVTPVVTGIKPADVVNTLYGKPIPISALGDSSIGGGLARIGTAGLIFGPYPVGGSTVSFGVSFGFPSNPSGTRRVYEISLDGKVAWELAGGSAAGAIDPAGFLTEPFTVRFYSGTMSQAADPLEVTYFGAEAVAYRPQMLLFFENLPLARFNNVLPFISCKIGDVTGGAVAGDGINLGTALESVAYSPWVEYTSSDFETVGVTDIVQAMILSEDQSFIQLLQNTARFYRTLDILQTDKLRVSDRGATVTPDRTLGRDHVVDEDGVQYTRVEESAVPRELELITIDPDADYVFIPSKASRPRYPVPVTSSVGKETITLPVVINAATRAVAVTYAKYQEDNARKKVSLRGMLYALELEPGDLFSLENVADGFEDRETFKIIETSHNADWTVDITAEAILKCMIPGDPYFGEVVLLLHFNDGNGATSFEDSSQYAKTFTSLVGGAVSNTWVKFGSGSLYTGGSGGATSSPESIGTEWDLSNSNTSPYTIEMFVRFNELTTGGILICRDTGMFGMVFNMLQAAASTEITYHTSSNGSSWTASLTTSGAGLAISTDYHVAVDKDSTGKVRIYVNGVMRASDTPANSTLIQSLPDPITVGISGLNLAALDGYIDDVRITKGISRYGDVYGDGSFTPPAAQFPDTI